MLGHHVCCFRDNRTCRGFELEQPEGHEKRAVNSQRFGDFRVNCGRWLLERQNILSPPSVVVRSHVHGFCVHPMRLLTPVAMRTASFSLLAAKFEQLEPHSLCLPFTARSCGSLFALCLEPVCGLGLRPSSSAERPPAEPDGGGGKPTQNNRGFVKCYDL